MAYSETIRVSKTETQFIEAGSFAACTHFIDLGYKQDVSPFFPTLLQTHFPEIQPRILNVHTRQGSQRPGYTIEWKGNIPEVHLQYTWLKKHEASALKNLGQTIEDISFRAGIHAHLAVLQRQYPREQLFTVPLSEYIVNRDVSDAMTLSDAAFFIGKKLGY